jgi:hypothetical protein
VRDAQTDVLFSMMDGESVMVMQGSAVFSPCRTWRYALARRWAPDGQPVMFVALNPSTADETLDDPTVRRCIGFAKRWGFPAMLMLNAFALRSTDPRALYSAADPVGPENDTWLLAMRQTAARCVVCWGAHGALLDRGTEVVQLVAPVFSFGFTKDGFPKHPLYLPNNADLVEWR